MVYSFQQSKRHTTHHTTEDWADFWVGRGWFALCVQYSVSYRADGRAAIRTSDRPLYCFTQNENAKDLECSEGVLFSYAIRKGNGTRHSAQNVAYSQLSLLWKRFYLLLGNVHRHSYKISFLKLLVRSILPTASQHKRMTYTDFCIYRIVPSWWWAVSLLETCRG